jgi:hypothetical protein
MVGPFIFRCPATGLNVQHIFDDEAPETGDERAYVGVRCLAWPVPKADELPLCDLSDAVPDAGCQQSDDDKAAEDD